MLACYNDNTRVRKFDEIFKGEFKEMNNEILKQKVRELKEFGISYVSITKKLGWGETTLYRWMKGEFNLSEQKVEELTQLINKIGRME